ncbi:HAD family hydrolase, partial [Clostridium sp.]|uniref:HAD family hydrolase n=1 Tax=Clostridium sp. TaxID=1506 RepID=UPI003EEAD73E
LDSNFIKEKAIIKASKNYLDNENFVNYFIGNNGLPRNIKIAKYFNDKECSVILNNYNNILKISLLNASFTKNIDSFINKLEFYKLKPYILSGGEKEEIISLLQERCYLNKFNKIMGGPLTKYENLDNLKLEGNVLYIGDSLIDYEVAKKYNFDFIFMYGYTQFSNWKEYFTDKKEVLVIKNFESLTYSHC